MTTYFGLNHIDLAVIVGYFTVVVLIGFWASSKVHTDEDFFLGGRRFGKGLLVMHWLCTGTHSEQAVQVCGATARVGLGGIWYQWMYLFSTPFYWLIAPMIRRLRVITTGDVFRIRYGRGLEFVYSLVALVYLVLAIAMLLRGAGAAIAGATGNEQMTNWSVIGLSVLFSTYIMAGGLMAAAYTDFLQGVLIVVLSFLLVPAGLNAVGGIAGLRAGLEPAMLSVAAPAGAKEGDILFIVAASLLGLAGIVAQPHVMTSNGAGKTETEARVGMCYGNFIKRLLTIAWAFTGLIAVVLFSDMLAELGHDEREKISETLFGRAIQTLLGDGWRGLMMACIIAGITSAETVMVVGSGVVTRNFYVHFSRESSPKRLLWVGRIASCGILLASILTALFAHSVTQLLTASVQVIGLLGPPMWAGMVWRRANVPAAWCSLLAGMVVWGMTSLPPAFVAGLPQVEAVVKGAEALSKAEQILLMLSAQCGALLVVSLLTRPQSPAQLDPFFARLLVPVGREAEFSAEAPAAGPHADDATLGLGGMSLDYEKARRLAYPALLRLGLEIPRLTLFDWGGFLMAWGMVAALLGLLVWLARLGA